MATATDIISRLGGAASLARETGFPLTTIASWGEANFIPEWRRAPVVAAAKRQKIALAMSDFPAASERIPRRPTTEQAAAA